MWRKLRGIVASETRIVRNLRGIVASEARMWRKLRGIVASETGGQAAEGIRSGGGKIRVWGVPGGSFWGGNSLQQEAAL